MRGPADVIRALRRRAQPRLHAFALARPLVAGRTGLEIGGPSSMFARGGTLPLYAIVGGLDNCNFGRTTVWEGNIEEGRTFVYDRQRPAGRQFIREAIDPVAIPGAQYGFVLSSHTLEHCANPLKALDRWAAAIEPGGAVVLVLPHKDGTFDHRRPVTSLDHLIADFERDTDEHDLTHLPEILALHDLALDPAAGDFAAFKARSERNAENRCLHHHVFDTHLAAQVIDRAGLRILGIEPTRPYHIVAVATKPGPGQGAGNAPFLGPDAPYRRVSPFVSDRE
jgi:SAM-dependent methyltransferase